MYISGSCRKFEYSFRGDITQQNYNIPPVTDASCHAPTISDYDNGQHRLHTDIAGLLRASRTN